MLKKIILLSIFVLLFLPLLIADTVRISQIDSSSLLLDQKIRLYIISTGKNGNPLLNLQPGMFNVSESSTPYKKDFKPVEILEFKKGINYEKGINFLLLVDNSGSMYRTLKGKRTRNKNQMRISQAKKAIISFLRSIKNPKDKVGLVFFNTDYALYTRPINDKVKIEKYLDQIERPAKGKAYTEMYASLTLAADEFSTVKGRKAILILTDGMNAPSYYYTGKPHEEFGRKIFKYKEPIRRCQEEGVSVFAINYGRDKKDKNIFKISSQTGGAVFHAYNPSGLKNIYNKIVEQILSEYLITYKATMEPADKKYVKVKFLKDEKMYVTKRFYFSSTILGLPLEKFILWLLLPLLLAPFLLWLLSKLKFENKQTAPTLEVLNKGAKTRVSTKTLLLGSNKTVIGGSANANMTIAGGPVKVQENHATILFDDNKKKYTVVSEGELMVNNKPVKTKVLESGDVLGVGGTTIVFDEGAMKKKK